MARVLPLQRLNSRISATNTSASAPYQHQKKVGIFPELVASGSIITVREYDVLSQLLEGQTTRQMAETLGVKSSTIRTYLRNLFGKTHTSPWAALVGWWTCHSGENPKKWNGRDRKE